jgi:hypothetical protein
LTKREVSEVGRQEMVQGEERGRPDQKKPRREGLELGRRKRPYHGPGNVPKVKQDDRALAFPGGQGRVVSSRSKSEQMARNGVGHRSALGAG